jgi:hypothetical protein
MPFLARCAIAIARESLIVPSKWAAPLGARNDSGRQRAVRPCRRVSPVQSAEPISAVPEPGANHGPLRRKPSAVWRGTVCALYALKQGLVDWLLACGLRHVESRRYEATRLPTDARYQLISAWITGECYGVRAPQAVVDEAAKRRWSCRAVRLPRWRRPHRAFRTLRSIDWAPDLKSDCHRSGLNVLSRSKTSRRSAADNLSKDGHRVIHGSAEEPHFVGMAREAGADGSATRLRPSASH